MVTLYIGLEMLGHRIRVAPRYEELAECCRPGLLTDNAATNHVARYHFWSFSGMHNRNISEGCSFSTVFDGRRPPPPQNTTGGREPAVRIGLPMCQAKKPPAVSPTVLIYAQRTLMGVFRFRKNGMDDRLDGDLAPLLCT